ncbi:hypothetical protein CVU76_03485 [Candidatus Dojkabacteria bacterium HGW-Dojkabacteria-1]|uniref:Major facilitator superfamily (MFS) profile domain-containing protein n=1 Tax=Candidatus Dojkabacteria bacterium HGW-Dojkabacteria-1 TaxID=2013761 RepID=A0A2N2F4E8_9BACT|nr:MAG: hypothetical protein CVU76_03485 [Candidatus Dojkabacteria bacterium HGW-Dojkabacteria-1]
MIGVLLGIIAVFLVVFLEHMFLSLFAFSVALLVIINIWGRIDFKLSSLIVILTGLALDVTLHLPLGFNILVLGTVLFVFFLISLMVPLDRTSSRYSVIFFVFLFGYILNPFLASILQDSVVPSFSWSDIFKFVFNSLISVLICILIDRILFSFRDSNNFEKIRLR